MEQMPQMVLMGQTALSQQTEQMSRMEQMPQMELMPQTELNQQTEQMEIILQTVHKLLM
jgi:hypothetical protein